MKQLFTYLALGDSYTIGEQVPVYESFPYQLVQHFRSLGLNYTAPEIVARTGWTTDELQFAINHTVLLPQYDLVSLLVGVNNQYRGRSPDKYATEFHDLLVQAIGFTGGKPSSVVVLSIPDWGVTPFAEDRNREQIREAINQFNAINQLAASKAGVIYIEITSGTREAAGNASLLASDGLHPSGKEYQRWVNKITDALNKKNP